MKYIVQDYVKLTGIKLLETEQAVKFKVYSVEERALDEPQEHWFPLSQISSITTSSLIASDKIKVAAWICVKKELI